MWIRLPSTLKPSSAATPGGGCMSKSGFRLDAGPPMTVSTVIWPIWEARGQPPSPFAVWVASSASAQRTVGAWGLTTRPRGR